MERNDRMEIPHKLKVGGQDVKVEFTNTIVGDKLGECVLWNGKIKVAEIYRGEPQTDSSQFNTFYHELTHAILDTMGEYELSADERFVSSFSGFLSEAIRSFEYSKD